MYIKNTNIVYILETEDVELHTQFFKNYPLLGELNKLPSHVTISLNYHFPAFY